MGKASFVRDNNIIHAYYTQTSQKGGQKSQVRIDRMTAERTSGTAWAGSYYVDGTLWVDGIQAALVDSRNGGETQLSPVGVEYPIGGVTPVTIEVSQPLGSPKTVTMQLKGNQYSDWYVGRSGEAFYMPVTIQVELEAIPQYKLNLGTGTGYEIEATRVSSTVGAPAGKLKNGDNVYIGDVLKFAVKTSTGYAVDSIYVNQKAFDISGTYTVKGDTNVTASVKQQGMAYIGNEMYIPYIYDGTKYVQVIPYIGNGSGWDILS